MTYINFTDANNNIVVDKFEYEFLVREFKTRAIGTSSFNELKEIIDSNSLKYIFYLYALYDDETVKQDLSSYITEGGSLSISYNSGTRRKLSINIFNEKDWIPNPIDGFLWKGSKFKLEIGVVTSSAEYVYPAGIFILKDFEMPHEYSKNEIKLEMVDKFGGLDGSVGGKIINGIYIPRGSNIVQMIKSLLKSKKIEGCCFDNKVPLFPSWVFEAVTPYTITESSDSTIGALITKLVSILNLDVFYDEYGRMCFEEMRENILIDSKPSLWTFFSDEKIYNSHSVKTDFQVVENVIEVEGANINGNIINVRIENSNPKSPTNVTLFEPTICKIVDENISSIDSAYKRAKYELFKKSLLPISMSFSTILVPSLSVNNVITISDKYCKLENLRFLINSINIPIVNTCKMDLSISNLEEVAFSGR